MPRTERTVVGADACPVGWFATVIDADGVRYETYEAFENLRDDYLDADRILVDIPIGLPDSDRRRCDEDACDLLGSCGISVFYPPCRSAVELSDYEAANEEHRDEIGHGLSQQAHNIRQKILKVDDIVGNHYDGTVRESHPELCFAALNSQPIAYSKSSTRGLGLRMKLLSDELDGAERLYQEARDEYFLKEVRRDDILDSMVLAVATRNENLTTVPPEPSPDTPRIYYPDFEVPTIDVE